MKQRESKGLIRFCSLLILLAGVMPILLAQDPVFTARVSAKKVPQHTVFDIQFELQNGSGTGFTAPYFTDFEVVGGPSVGSSMMSINGKVSQSQTWSYSLLAVKQGKFTIDPASVIAGRKKLTTRPLYVEVVEPRDINQNGSSTTSNEPVLLRAEINAEHYYPGQQIILTYRLLFRENVQTVTTISEDDYADFFIQNFTGFSREPTYETIQGIQFTSRIVKSMALFAHQSGTYTISPMLMNAGINAPFPGNQGFFTMHRIQEIQIASEPLTITILPLPPDAPTSFSGAVGQYKILTNPGNQQMSTDDAYSFRIEITGNGDSRRWDPPSAITTGNLEAYDPKILEDRLMDIDNQMVHIRTIEYQLITTIPGQFTVFVPLSYFDPEQKKYITISSDTLSIEVTQGNHNPDETKAENEANIDAPPLMKLRNNWLKDQFWISIPHLFIFGLILTGSLLSLIVAYHRKLENKIPEAEKLKSEAGRFARNQFDRLEQSSMEIPDKEFFEQAVEIYYKFLVNRFGIPPSELDESNLSGYLGRAGLTVENTQKASLFFHQCLTVRYGGTPGGFTREEMLQRCREIVGQLGG